jgi:hypothetical protein
MLQVANTVQLPTTAWQPGGITRTILTIVANVQAAQDGLVSLISQGGFLDFAGGGTVTTTNTAGNSVTTYVTPDPSIPAQWPTPGTPPLPGWLDILADSSFNCQRIQPTYAIGPLTIVNASGNTYGPFAPGTFHVQNPATLATYANVAALTIAPSSTTTTNIFDADVAGSSGTSGAGTITGTVTSLVGVTVTNAVAFVGSNAESNAQLVARCRLKQQALSPNGASGAYKYFALTSAQLIPSSAQLAGGTITRALVTPNLATGVVTTTIANANGPVSGVANLAVTGAANNGSGLVRLTVPTTGLTTGMFVTVTGVGGVPAAVGTWLITVIDGTHIDLVGSAFAGAYVSGGVVEAGDLGLVDAVIQVNAVPSGVTAYTVSASSVNLAVAATVYIPAALASIAASTISTALSTYVASLPIGGITADISNEVAFDAVLGAIFSAFPNPAGGSYVAQATLTLNGGTSNVTIGAGQVPTLSPTPAITVVGQ